MHSFLSLTLLTWQAPNQQPEKQYNSSFSLLLSSCSASQCECTVNSAIHQEIHLVRTQFSKTVGGKTENAVFTLFSQNSGEMRAIDGHAIFKAHQGCCHRADGVTSKERGNTWFLGHGSEDKGKWFSLATQHLRAVCAPIKRKITIWKLK